jgi:hypothetical protein
VTCHRCATLWIVSLLALVTGGCQRRDSNASAVDRADEAYVKLALALGERDRDSLDFYAGPDEWRKAAHAAYRPLAEVKTSADALAERLDRDQAAARDDTVRREFLIRQLRALSARVDVLSGRRLSFDRESDLLFGVVVGERDRAGFDSIREMLDRALSGSPAHAALDSALPAAATLAERYAAYDRRFVVPRDRLAALVARAIVECRRITLAHVTLPPDEHVTVEYVRGMPWSAFTTYEGAAHSLIRINTDFDLTVDRALALACHEAYPGHHAINTILDARLAKERGRVELTVQPLFSPQALRTEGAATYAPELAFSDAERVAFERDELFPLAGLNRVDAEPYVRVSRLVDRLGWLQADIARRYLDGSLEFVRAADALSDDALMANPDATLEFFNRFRTYAVTYTVGRDLVAAAVEKGGAEAAARWRAYEQWVTGGE